MHQLAIALKRNQKTVTGSDDEIFEPSRSHLEAEGLLPFSLGWDPNRITSDLDMVVVGMHAKADNPELLKAKQLGIKTVSYPELIFEHARDKQRIVVAGSHGKTTTTGMIMHVLQYFNRKFDYLVGAQVVCAKKLNGHLFPVSVEKISDPIFHHMLRSTIFQNRNIRSFLLANYRSQRILIIKYQNSCFGRSISKMVKLTNIAVLRWKYIDVIPGYSGYQTNETC